jgi:hypothetical protein
LVFHFGRCNMVCRKLEHRCFLTLPQISQQDHLPIGKFQRIMMRSRVVLVDLPKDGRRVFDHSRLPRKQTASAAPYRSREGKFCSRKNANRRLGIFRRSKPDCAGIEVLGSQFLASIGIASCIALGQPLPNDLVTFCVICCQSWNRCCPSSAVIFICCDTHLV